MTTTKPTPDTGGIPDFLRRDASDKPATAQPTKAAAMTSTKPITPQVAAPAGNTPLGLRDQPKAKRAAAAKSATKAKPAKAKAKDAAADEDGPKVTRSIVPVRYKARYAEHEDTCGTDLSLALKHATTGKNEDGRVCLLIPELKAVAEANDIEFSVWTKAKLNNGQLRMNTYNRLVGRLNAGEDVRIGKRVFRAKDWVVPTKPGLKAKVAKDAQPVKAKAKPAQAQQPQHA